MGSFFDTELTPRLPATAVVNSEAAAQTEIAEMLLESGWELGAHGLNNSTGNAALSREEEASAIGETLKRSPQNWDFCSPSLCPQIQAIFLTELPNYTGAHL